MHSATITHARVRARAHIHRHVNFKGFAKTRTGDRPGETVRSRNVPRCPFCHRRHCMCQRIAALCGDTGPGPIDAMPIAPAGV